MDNTYYLNMVTSLYRDKPKFISFLNSLLTNVASSSAIADIMSQVYDLDEAVADRLDTLGTIVGAERVVDFTPTDGSSQSLTDDYYRVVLKARIAQNLWDGKPQSLIPLWSVLFPGGKIMVKDNQDMTMDVFVAGSVPLMIRDLVKYGYVVPKPQSVGIRYYFFSYGDKPVFGYDLDSTYISGYDKAVWAFAEELALFSYDQDTVDRTGYDRGAW